MPVTCPYPSVPVLVQCPYPSELVVSLSTLCIYPPPWRGEQQSPETRQARETAGRELRGRAALGLPARLARRDALGARLVVTLPPRRRAGGAKERRARGATDGTRKEEDEERAAAARDFPAELRR